MIFHHFNHINVCFVLFIMYIHIYARMHTQTHTHTRFDYHIFIKNMAKLKHAIWDVSSNFVANRYFSRLLT